MSGDDLVKLRRRDLQTLLDGVADAAVYSVVGGIRDRLHEAADDPTATIAGLRDVVAGYALQHPELTSVLRQMAREVAADPHRAGPGPPRRRTGATSLTY